jgi:hypothetical protein
VGHFSRVRLHRNELPPCLSASVAKNPPETKCHTTQSAGPIRIAVPLALREVEGSEQREPRGSFREWLRAHFYSTMKKSRNPYISMKTNDRCHFYSTMKPGVAALQWHRHSSPGSGQL